MLYSQASIGFYIIMKALESLHPQYVTDESGEQTAVLLPVMEFNQLLEDLTDLAAIAERVDEPSIPHASVVADLRENGLLPN